MNIESLRDVFFWCAVVNYGVLLWWFLAFMLAHDWIHRLHARWFQLSVAQFDTIHYSGMALYKIVTLVLNVAPYCGAYRYEQSQLKPKGTPISQPVSIGNKISKAFVRRHVNHNGFKNTHPIHFKSGYGTDPHQTPIGIKVITAQRDTPCLSRGPEDRWCPVVSR